ncbi:MAG: 7-cyano-7-deazaguanine synthase QueC [Planctomycetota bacterium]
MPEKAVVLHSGGLDSTVCLLLAKEKGRDVLSLGVDYGQRHRIELYVADQQCLKFGLPRKVLRIEWDKPSHPIPVNRSLDEIRSGVSPAFLPGRNIVFLSLACAEAAGIGASEVWIGVNAIDFSGYPDCRPDFIESYRRMLHEGIPNGAAIVAPLLSMTKPEIAREAIRLALNPGDTWSCYQPQMATEGISPCGKCDACILHAHAWREACRRKED